MDAPPQYGPEEYRHIGGPPIRRFAFRVTADGLVEVYPTGREVTTPWWLVRVGERRADYAEVSLGGRDVGIDRRYADWERLVARIEELSRDANRGPVPPGQVAEWLGIPLGGTVLCEARRPRWQVLVLVLLECPLLLLLLLGLRLWGWLLVAPVLGGTLSMLLSAERVSADCYGLSVRAFGRSRRFAWADLRGIKTRSRDCRVLTTHGAFSIARRVDEDGRAAQVIEAALRCLQAGVRLPAEQPPSGGAISRMAGDAPDANADCGISISPEPD